MRVRRVVEVDHGLVSAGALNDLFAVAGHCVILFGNRAKDIEDNRPTAYYRVLEDVPSFVELRWRPGEHQAALT